MRNQNNYHLVPGLVVSLICLSCMNSVGWTFKTSEVMVLIPLQFLSMISKQMDNKGVKGGLVILAGQAPSTLVIQHPGSPAAGCGISLQSLLTSRLMDWVILCSCGLHVGLRIKVNTGA